MRFGDYAERRDPVLGRWSNDSLQEDSKVRIAPNFRWRIKLE